MMYPNHQYPLLSKCELQFEWFDCGFQIGIAVTAPDGHRFALRSSADDLPKLFMKAEAVLQEKSQ